MNKKKLFQIILSVLFTAFLIILILQFISFKELIAAINLVSLKFIIYGFFLHLFTYFVRTLMLYSFLRNEKITFNYLLSAHFIQNFFVHIIPASLGELSFPILLKDKIKTTHSLSALLLTKISMLVTLFILFILSVFILFNGIIKINIVMIILGVASIISFVIGFIIISGSMKKTNNKILHKINNYLINLKNTLLEDLNKFKDLKFSIWFFFLTLLSNFSLAFFYIIILEGLGINLRLWQSIFISSIGMIFLVIPIKSIGGFGTSEGSWAIGMTLLGFDGTIGLQSGFITHIYALINVFLLMIIGVIFFYVERYKMRLSHE